MFEERLKNTFVEDSNLLIQLWYIFYWNAWTPFQHKILKSCEYCRKLRKGFPCRKRTIEGFSHQLGVFPTRIRRIHKDCAQQLMEFEREFHSGEIAECIDCKNQFYLKWKNNQDCPVKGMARGHRMKGEENLLIM